MNDIEIQRNYDLIKKDIKDNIINAAKSFIYIGYQLKQVQELKLYELDGYSDIHEFGLIEYGFSKSTTNRYIDINKEFSIGGNSPDMLEDYQGCSISLLQELLPLTEEERQLFTEKSKREDIREYKKIKKDYENEVVLEELNQDNEEEGPEENIIENDSGAHARHLENTNVTSIFPTEENRVIQLLIRRMFGESGQQKKRHEQLLEVQKHIISDSALKNERIVEVINPNGNDTFKQPPVYLFLYEYKAGIKYRDFREQSAEFHIVNWDKFIDSMVEVFDFTSQDPWLAYYGEEEKTQKEEKEPKEVKKATNTNTTERKVEKKTTVTIKDTEEVPGQIEIDDYKEYLPDDRAETLEAEVVETEFKEEQEEGSSVVAVESECYYCKKNTRIGQGDFNLQIVEGKLQVFNNSGEIVLDVEINHCPICGEKFN